MQHNFQTDITEFEEGRLPENWEWLQCSKLAKVAKYNGEPNAYFKEFIPKNRLDTLKFKIRGNRCERWVKQAKIAVDAKLLVPEVLSTGILNNKNPYLITAAGPSTCVPDFLYKSPNTDEVKRKQWIKDFAQYIGKMHKAGIIHGDLRAGNILMSISSGRSEFMMIDIERNSYHKVIPMRLVKKNLVQLIKRLSFDTFTARDRILFLNIYNQSYGCFHKTEKNN